MTERKLLEIWDAAYSGDERVVVDFLQQRNNLREDDIGALLLMATVVGYQKNAQFVSPDASANVRTKVFHRMVQAFAEAGLEANPEMPLSAESTALLNDIYQDAPEVIDILNQEASARREANKVAQETYTSAQEAREANGLIVLNEDGLRADDILPGVKLTAPLLVGERLVNPVHEKK